MIFYKFFSVFLRRYLSMKSLLLCLLLLPVLAGVGVVSLQSRSTATGLTAGILCQATTPHAQDTARLLLEQTDVTFSLYSDLTSLTAAVADGTIAAGYVLRENFDAQLAALQMDNLVQLIKLEDDFYHSYLNELVYTAIYTQMTPYITQDFLSSLSIALPLDVVQSNISTYLDGDTLFSMDLVSVQSLETGEELLSPLPLVRGALAVGLLTLTLLASATMAQTQRGWALFAPHLSRLRSELYAISPIYLLAMVAAAVTLLVASGLSLTPIQYWTELGRVALYQLSLMVLALALPRLIGRDTIVLLLPFLLLFVVISHPIFFDITTFFPSWKHWLSFLPSYLYLG